LPQIHRRSLKFNHTIAIPDGTPLPYQTKRYATQEREKAHKYAKSGIKPSDSLGTMQTFDTVKLGNSTLFKQAKSPFYNLRVMVKGQRRQFSTGESTKAKATDKARIILADLKSRGLGEAITLHSRRVDETPADPTLDEFAKLYQKVMAYADYPPSIHTQARYIKTLKFIGNVSRLNRIRSLTPAKIKTFIASYQEMRLQEHRTPDSVKVSLNSILRNAAALFSKSALAGYADHGLVITNPFKGLKLRRVAIKGFSPLKPEILQTIWGNAALLRDGNPDATPPPPHAGRWGEPDLRKPHPEAYLLLLLELGLGLRRNESDKAEWEWIFSDAQGRTFLEVKSTPFFIPKSGERRVIPLAKLLHDTLLAYKTDSRFIVPGREPSIYAPGKEPKNLVYRCDLHHRALARWLRLQGVSDGKPCHVMRKQFGSYVATVFSLYHAQKFLGHSSPKVTSDYYAGLVELPEIDNVKQLANASPIPTR
jgi:integrase